MSNVLLLDASYIQCVSSAFLYVQKSLHKLRHPLGSKEMHNYFCVSKETLSLCFLNTRSPWHMVNRHQKHFASEYKLLGKNKWGESCCLWASHRHLLACCESRKLWTRYGQVSMKTAGTVLEEPFPAFSHRQI